jgi:hypothetical protein
MMPQLVVLTKLPPEVTSVCQLPAGFKAQPLGSRAEVLSLIAELCPDADFSDPALVTWNRGSAQVEFILGENDPLESVQVRRPTNDVLRRFCQRTGWRAVDPMSDIIALD